jgi:hypothetical protein
LAWLALELGAGIIALTLLVAILPLVLVLLSEPVHPGLAAAATLAISLPLAILLGAAGFPMVVELGRSTKSP